MQTTQDFRKPAGNRRGLTLIELLVVIAILAVLMVLLIPAVMSARTAARDNACRKNLKEWGVAISSFESSRGHYPSSWKSTRATAGSTDINGWSGQAQLLPYMEEGAKFKNIDFNVDYNLAASVTTADGEVIRLSALRNPLFLCPLEEQDEVRFSGGAKKHYPLNYALNLGTWFVFDPSTRQGGNGLFYPDSKIRHDEVGDGATYTIAMAEVKGWNPYYRNAQLANPPMPTVPADVCTLGGTFKANSGHTEWVDGRAHQVGFTSVFLPNTQVFCTESGVTYDVDWTNWQEGKDMNAAAPNTAATFAAVTARSYHGDKINVVMLDGTVRPISNTINIGVWRALTTRSGSEILPEGFLKD